MPLSTSLWSIREGRFTPKNWTNATTKWWQLVAKLVTNAQLYFTSPPQNTFGLLYNVISTGCLIEEKIDYRGNDLRRFTNVPSKEECAKKAAAVKDAKFWTYSPKHKKCFSKTSMKGRRANPDSVSGNVECANGQKSELKNSSYQRLLKIQMFVSVKY